MLRDFPRLFLQHTAATRRHLAPELLLRLITPACPLWAAPVDRSPFADPYWGFFWPGGQAAARYMLDNRATVFGRRVLDVGCGCGAGAIAAALMGATKAVANDIDPYAVLATKINAELNKCTVETSTEDYIGTACDDFDTILIGDMFYDEDFAKLLFEWLSKLAAKDKMVLIGDPGRHGLTSRRRSQLQQLARYELPAHCREENHGFTEAAVWRLTSPTT
ncbi:electron transfer flavoprotein beta subunit lysine methyltransferase-like [Aricia agestis]|uniref:electron transfer flavoprotein beta subunit lysine methyltransferase-like n=1 Tax=Aricia agestis TaxID=91739 RepID=UPI001C205F86|nr:electron transfer flavoprotein beta subunit lysine methyltransferase-like [Aricia agestis]XP_041971367.1 electron transfer flavoprotein beta subunit lysine methyltransferase-like [Aricia agestis]XP_041971368.1 electron transfer flavoprotein beta subunit lysine methyltransferase-like [Aricia agestis]